MRTCTRCGVEFDGVSQWCGDCMEVEDAYVEWPVLTGHETKEQNASAWEQRWGLIEPLYQEGKYDNEIAAELGVKPDAILKARKRFGKPANRRADRYMWHDQAAHQRHASKMVYQRENVKRGSMRLPTSFDKS